MNIISTTEARKNISAIVDMVTDTGTPVLFGRRDVPEAILIQYPKFFNKHLSDTTNMAMYGGAFDFLQNEPEIYSVKDLKKKYV